MTVATERLLKLVGATDGTKVRKVNSMYTADKMIGPSWDRRTRIAKVSTAGHEWTTVMTVFRGPWSREISEFFMAVISICRWLSSETCMLDWEVKDSAAVELDTDEEPKESLLDGRVETM